MFMTFHPRFWLPSIRRCFTVHFSAALIPMFSFDLSLTSRTSLQSIARRKRLVLNFVSNTKCFKEKFLLRCKMKLHETENFYDSLFCNKEGKYLCKLFCRRTSLMAMDAFNFGISYLIALHSFTISLKFNENDGNLLNHKPDALSSL